MATDYVKQQAMNDPEVTFIVGLLWYMTNPGELRKDLARDNIQYPIGIPETLGFLPALIAIAVPVVAAGLTSYVSAKGAEKIANDQTAALAQQAAIIQANAASQARYDEQKSKDNQKMIFMGLGGAAALLLIFKLL